MGVLREITERTLKDKEDLRKRVEKKKNKGQCGAPGGGRKGTSRGEPEDGEGSDKGETTQTK